MMETVMRSSFGSLRYDLSRETSTQAAVSGERHLDKIFQDAALARILVSHDYDLWKVHVLSYTTSEESVDPFQHERVAQTVKLHPQPVAVSRVCMGMREQYEGTRSEFLMCNARGSLNTYKPSLLEFDSPLDHESGEAVCRWPHHLQELQGCIPTELPAVVSGYSDAEMSTLSARVELTGVPHHALKVAACLSTFGVIREVVSIFEASDACLRHVEQPQASELPCI